MHNYLAAAAAVFGLCKIRWSPPPPTMNINARAIEKQNAAVVTASAAAVIADLDVAGDIGYRKAARA